MLQILPETRMVIMRGVSGSGKSTAAQKIKDSEPDRWVTVCRDTLREEIIGKDNIDRYFEQGLDRCLEDHITTLEHETIARALGAGKDVIIDNTNIQPKYILEYFKIARDFDLAIMQGSTVIIQQYDVSFEEAQKRVRERGERFVKDEVIRRQLDQLRSFPLDENFVPQLVDQLRWHKPKHWFVPPFEVEPYVERNLALPRAIICDLDGTLAHRTLLREPKIGLRSFFDYEKCGTDRLDPFVSSILLALVAVGNVKIIFMTGRKKVATQLCRDFIDQLRFPEDQYILLTRDEDIDVRWDHKRQKMIDQSDDVVKYRLFNEYVRGKYAVIGAIDDRKRVVALWEALGLNILNVGGLNECF